MKLPYSAPCGSGEPPDVPGFFCFFFFFYRDLFKRLFIVHQNLLEHHLKGRKALSAEIDILASSETIVFTFTI